MENELHIEEQLLEADKLYEEGEYLECKRRLLELLDQEPGFGRAHFLLGCLYHFILGDHTKGERHLELAVRFSPEFPTAYLFYARVLNLLGRRDKLQALVTQSMKVSGINKCLMLMELAKSHEVNGETRKALTLYYEAEGFAVTVPEVQEVRFGITRLIGKKLRPVKRIFLLK